MLDASLSKLSKHPWATVAEVGDQSLYVADMARALRLIMPRVRSRLGDSPFRNFCDKFGKAFMSRYQAAVFRCKKIGDQGAQQLLLDAQAIRTLLLAAPGMRGAPEGASGGGGGTDEEELDIGSLHDSEPSAPPPPVYAKFVQREMPRVEMLLKIIASPKERFGDTIKALWPEASLADLTRVMDLKGMSSKEKNDILVGLGLAKPSAPILPTLGLSVGGGGSSSSSAAAAAAAAASSAGGGGGGAGISGVTVGSFAGAGIPAGSGSSGGMGGGGSGANLGANIASSMKDMGNKLSMKDMGKLFKKKDKATGGGQ